MDKEKLDRMPKSWLVLREIFLKEEPSDEIQKERVDPDEKDKS